VLYRLDAPWWLPVNDPVNQLVFAETGASVDTVIVAGRVVMDERRIATFDATALFDEINAMVASLRKRNDDLFQVAHAIAAIVP
jgi:cytosine/adenosine deaminase-related metal-dependent hydrolase